MTKGFKRDGKFIPITDYNKKGTRKSRDKTTKIQGVRMKRDSHVHQLNPYWGGWYCPKCKTGRYAKMEGTMKIDTTPIMHNRMKRDKTIKTQSIGLRKIRIGENPQGTPKINKFIDSETGEGLRGSIVALSKDNSKAIILSMNSSFEKGVKWGGLYEIEEIDPDQYPMTVRKVSSIPNTEEWRIIK